MAGVLVTWEIQRGSDGHAFWTELGSVMGVGDADWDLEAFLKDYPCTPCYVHRDLSQDPSQANAPGPLACSSANRRLTSLVCSCFTCPLSSTLPTLSVKVVKSVPLRLIHSTFNQVEDGAAADVQSDDESFWDAEAELEDDEGWSDEEAYFSPRSGKGEEDDEVMSEGSSSESEDLDRWMAGSQSFTTEDSVTGSAASSTLDFSEWASMDASPGSLLGAPRPFSLGLRFGLVKPPPPASPPVKVLYVSPRADSGKLATPAEGRASQGALWSLRHLVSPGTGESSAGASSEQALPRGPSELALDRPGDTALACLQRDVSKAVDADVSAPHSGVCTPPHAVDEVEGSDARGAAQVDAGSPRSFCQDPDSSTQSRLQLLGRCLSPSAVAAGGGGGREVLDLIPDVEVAHMMGLLTKEEADLLEVAQETPAGKDKEVAVTAPDSPSTEGNTQEEAKDGVEDGGKLEQWRIVMKKSTDSMEYSSWFREHGRHFGGLEYRGRLILMPEVGGLVLNGKDQCSATNKPKSGFPGNASCAGQQQGRWGPEAVRDFLLDELHRTEWDENREISEMLEDWDESGCSTARWVRKLPFFLRSREYVVGRRVWSRDDCAGTYLCISKGMDHPAAPAQKSTVRVSKFYSSWRVRPLSREETAQHRALLSSGGQGKGRGRAQSKVASASEAEPVQSAGDGMWEDQAVEIITHYEEESSLPRDLVRMGVAHGMWGVMQKMEKAMRKYCASGRNLRHILPVSLLQAEQKAVTAHAVAAGLASGVSRSSC